MKLPHPYRCSPKLKFLNETLLCKKILLEIVRLSSPPPMICMVLVAELIIPASVQRISTPFRPSLTFSIITLVISGKSRSVESLEKVNITVELIISGEFTRPVGPSD